MTITRKHRNIEAWRRLLKHIETIAATAQDVVRSLGNVVWALNPENDMLANFLAYTREYAGGYFVMAATWQLWKGGNWEWLENDASARGGDGRRVLDNKRRRAA